MEGNICRICLEEESDRSKLIKPCRCDGSSKYVHKTCLHTWIKTGYGGPRYLQCQACHASYIRKDTSEEDITNEVFNAMGTLCLYVTMFFVLAIILSWAAPLMGYLLLSLMVMILYFTCILLTGSVLAGLLIICGYTWLGEMIKSKDTRQSRYPVILGTVICYLSAVWILYTAVYPVVESEIQATYRSKVVQKMFDLELKNYVELD